MKFKSLGLGLVAVSAILSAPSAALANSVFWSPRIDGLEIDRCINSYQYPDGCSRGATEQAARMFCRRKGYSHANSWQWEDQSTDDQRSVYKLLEERGSSYFKVEQGSYVFTGISCVGWS